MCEYERAREENVMRNDGTRKSFFYAAAENPDIRKHKHITRYMVVFLIGGLELWVLRIPEFVPEFLVFIICDCFFLLL